MNNKKLLVKNNKRYFEEAVLEKRNKLYVLHLKGSAYDIGYQHGILLREEIEKGAVKFYSDTLRNENLNPLKKLILKQVLKKKIYNPLEKAQPKEILEQFHGISDGSGLSYNTIFRGNHRANITMILTPILFRTYLKKFNNLGIDLEEACSTFMATKEATSKGITIVGRNTDYSGVHLWPKYQTISFVEPDDGFKYAQIGSAGVLMWAPGMNEEGIVVCAHSMKYEDVDPNGWSIPAFTDKILRDAQNLEDARKILKKNPRGVSCGFVVTDGKSKNAFAAEISKSKATIRWMEDNHLIMTNMAISEDKRKIDLVSKYNLNEGCPGRYRRLKQLIEKNFGKIDPSLAAKFMGDHIRYTTGTERNAYGIIAVDDNVNSMVFSPEELKLWIAAGPAPVCNNPYIGFNFKQEIKGNTSNSTLETLEGYKFKDQNKKKGMKIFNQAYGLFESNPKKLRNILNLIQEALNLDPEEIIYYQMIAKIMIHLGQYNDAMGFISKALEFKQSLNEKTHNYLLLGILYDLKKDRENSIKYYDKIEKLAKEGSQDPWFKVNRVLVAFANKYRKEAFNKKNLKERSVSINFSQGSGIE
ncbi:MAG: hypothetical protein EU548_07815 [Promethearchaeota archaeon]|nr:MAG: hypothetical protein EU548_07815 [Candidatus Lokiarchaeota archaeon]